MGLLYDYHVLLNSDFVKVTKGYGIVSDFTALLHPCYQY